MVQADEYIDIQYNIEYLPFKKLYLREAYNGQSVWQEDWDKKDVLDIALDFILIFRFNQVF